MIHDSLHSIQSWMDGLHPVLQWLMLFVLGATPLVEAFLGTAIGVVVGIPWPLALLATACGNFTAIFVAAFFGQRINAWWRRRHPRAEPDPDRKKVAGLLARYGPIGACIVAPILIPSPIAAFLIASSGVPRRLQLTVMTCTFLTLGTIGGVLATLGVDLLSK